MITKFETKSNRVKGLCFHPTRPWVLASLHSGIIQLWDYRIRTLLDRFDEHDGPVRGVSFHITQPLFCSGGDDYKIKVWNYKQRRCLFTLMGHLDYIRTVQFHHENPWILSCSDDQTIRIWNWQSRSCVSVLTGHNHYVMCAQFHPKEDLVVSASLDQTVRVWDISGLRKKSISARPTNDSDGLRLQNDLFGSTDAVVKYVLEGHDRGVNWATFHPTSPLIISGADDRQVKLWRMNDSKAWEVDTFRGHFSNVSCVLFHPRQDLILSNSEDKTIRVWDMSKRTGIQTFRREHDRFWVLSAHPELNLFAAGHDSGMLVFKLERERPAFASNEDSILFIKDRYLRSFEYASQRDNPLMGIRRSSSGLGNKIRTMSYNPQDRAVLMISDSEGGFYELYLIPRTGNTDNVESKRGLGTSAVFVGRKRFAVLDKTNQIILKSLSNEEVKRFSVPGVNAIFEAPVGQLLLRQDDKISLFDISQRKTIAELMSSRIKSAVWTPQTLKNPFVALLGKDVLIIANRKLEQVAMIHETIQIKSGAWDDEGVFIYSTLNHIKYCLPNGDHGIVRTLETPVYITSVIKSKIYCLDRETRNRIIYIDPTEYRFKMALHKKKYDVILKMVQESNLIGQSIISYLQKKGFPEIALYFVQDPKTKFGLALECGNIDIALETAKILEDKECWEQLAVVALEQGDIQTVELAYRQTLNFEKLSFLYLITGSSNKLVKMAKLAERRQDIMSRFHNSLFIGDISARVQILEEVGQLPLAYITATIHGLEEQQESLALKLEKQGLEIPSVPMKSILLQPPIPVQKPKQKESEGWPLLNVSTQNLFGIDFTSKASTKTAKQFNLAGDEDIEVTGDWDDDALDAPDAENMDDNWGETDEVIGGEDGEEGGWEEDALEGLEDTDISSVNIKDEFWIPPQPALPTSQIWVRNSELPVDHIAAGSFETAMLLLNQQAGIIDFEPLKSLFLNIYTSTRLSIPATTSVPPLQYALQRNILDLEPSPNARLKGLPLLPVNLENLTEKLKQAYKSTTLGKFGDALSSFLYILHGITLLVVESKHEENEVKELLEICKDYILGLNIELKRKELVAAKENPILQTELAAYFTHSNLQVSHLLLALRSAMNCCYRLKNYSTASTFAKRLLELGPKPDLATQARKVIKFAESNNTDEQELNYDPKNPFVVCSSSLTPIYAGTESVNCSFCGAPSLPKFAGRVCSVCKIGEIGKKCSGLQWLKSGKVTLKYAKK